MAHPPRPHERAGRPRRRRPLAWVLVVAFVVVPLVEVFLLVQVGQVIGPWWTILLLVASGLVGGWLMRREGAQAWRALTGALASGRMPGRELADAALILVGGTLMLTPGFASDVVGIALILPMTRPVARRLLAGVVTRRLLAAPGTAGPAPWGAPGGRTPPHAPRPGDRRGGPVVRGEVVED